MPNTAQHLVELAQQVRGETLRLLAAASATALRWAPAGTSNHILWHAGHALWAQDLLFVELVTGRSELPPGWSDTFGSECRPVRQSDQQNLWPDRSEVGRLLAVQLERVIDLLRSVPNEQLATDAPPVDGDLNLASCIVHAWHDEAKHQGEMFLLLKQHRAQAFLTPS